MKVTAIMLSNVLDKVNFELREEQYMVLIAKYNREEQQVFSELYATLVLAIEENQEQDFLGELFMKLELGNHWKGQFFTPYNLCDMMAQMQINGIEGMLKQKGYMSVNDPTCGAGALLIAIANACRNKEINYHNHILFVAQDIDITAGLMCYIQLSLLGCPGYVVIGDSLSHPITNDLKDHEVWYTPFYFSEVWYWRRAIGRVDNLINLTNDEYSKSSNEIQKPRRLQKESGGKKHGKGINAV